MARADPNGAVALLRARTASAHEAVDAAFGRYRLDDRDGYRAMLLAHARALPAAERVLAELPFARTLPARTALLRDDLADLGAAMPDPAAWTPPGGEAGLWGLLYVVEGSRLGGVMITRGVPDGFPRRYLAAGHEPGGWQRIREAIDAAACEDPSQRPAMIAGAAAGFDLYRDAVTPA